MRKKTVVVTLILVGLFSLFCQNASNPLESEISDSTNSYSLAKPGGGKGKPAGPTIEKLSFNGISLIENNEIMNQDSEFDVPITGPNPQIIFLASDGGKQIRFASIRLYYDANVDYDEWWNCEFNGYMWTEEYSDQNKTFIDEDFEWDGIITPVSNDPVYGSDYGHSPYELKNQLASYDGNEQPENDHFGIVVEVSSSEYLKLETFIWLNVSAQPEQTFHVQNIEYAGVTQGNRKNTIRPVYHVTIVDEEGGNLVNNATVYASFEGLNSSYYIYSSREWENGLAVIKGPTIKSNVHGELTMTVKSVNKYGWTYNPVNNNDEWGIWPFFEPNLTEQL
ncbi:hypothetical protein BVY01_00950 [bacterium I07]|nr:hypothetical protein BVY01_00950 [bacterium I07]